MKKSVENFGTNTQWRELGSSMTELRGKTDRLKVKVDDVHRQVSELAQFVDTVRILTFTGIMFLMGYLLVGYFG